MAEHEYPWETEEHQQKEQLRAALAAREKELDELRNQLIHREEMVDRRLAQDKKMLERRERELFNSWEKRSESLAEQEQAFARRQEEIERHFEVERVRAAEWRRESAEERRQLDELQRSLEQEKVRLTQAAQETLQTNSKRFVASALNILGVKEGRFHTIGICWAIGGALSLLVGVIIAVATMITSSDAYHQAGGASIGYYLFHLFRGLIVVGLCAALARYAFIFSNSYMHESLKAGDRAHAIRFGEFYLDTYGANAEWEQVKEAFAQWNITGQSAFSKQDMSSIDPAVMGAAGKVVEKAIDAASAAAKKADPA
jgi:hypothetical protein